MMMNNFLYSNLINDVKKGISVKTGKISSMPIQVSIQISKRCNSRCLMCNSWKETNDYLNSKEIINTLIQLKKWIKNIFFVHIAGGEPLIFKGIYDIFSFCSENGIICKISTNGIALSEKNCDKIIYSKLPYLSVSLDSHLPEIHDKFRGVNGTFEKAVEGVKYLSKNGNLTLGISSILMKDNVSTFEKSVDYFLKLPIHRLLIQPIRIWTENLAIKNWNEYEYWINDFEVLKSFTDYLIVKKREDRRILNTENDILEWIEYFKSPITLVKKQFKKCRIGYDRLLVTNKGEIFLGCDLFGSLGNIKNDDIKKLWYSDKASSIRKKMYKCRFPCTSNCFKELTLKSKISKAIIFIKSGLFNKNKKMRKMVST